MSERFASICLLSYNRLVSLSECLNSAVKNAGMPVEVIVHDDGSDKDTQRSLTWMLNDGRISRLVLNPPGHNEGVGAAINRSFDVARGDPVVKMDQDLAEFRPGWLAQAASWLDQDERLGMLGLFRYELPPVAWPEMNHRAPYDGAPYEYCDDFVGSCMIVPRRILDTFGRFDEHSTAFAEDYVYKQRLRASQRELGLPVRDMAVNRGFGPPNSTVVSYGASYDDIVVTAIHDRPRILNEVA